MENLDPSLLETITKALENQELNTEETIALEKELLRVEKYYYDKFQGLTNDEKSEIINELAKLNPYGVLPAKLNKEFNIFTLDNETIVSYILTVLNGDPAAFKNAYIKAISEDSFKDIVPLYPQMLVVKEAISAFYGSNYINEYLSKVTSNFPDNSLGMYLKNQIIVSGSAGSGKTKVIAKLFKDIIKSQNPNTKFISYALKQDRANELHNIIESEEVYNGFDIYSK